MLSKYASIFFIAISLVLFLTALERNIVWMKEMTLWQDVIKKSPVKARGYNNVGQVYLSIGLYQKAVDLFRVSIDLDPWFEETHYNLALAYFKMGNFTDAVKEFKKTIDVGTYLKKVNFAEPRLLILSLNKLAESYFLAGIFDEAIKTFVELLKVDAASAADIHYNIGLCYERLGNYALAMQEFQNVLRLKPEDEGALWNLKELQMK